MSEGVFSRTRYQAVYDANNIHPIRVQPETLTMVIGGQVNAPPAGTATNPISAKVSKTRRSIGLRPTTVTVKFTGEPPGDYTGDPITLPLLAPAIRGVAILGATGTYQESPIEVVGVRGEEVG